ncbi:hypothetical protein [Testudinibacter sp. TR-2022]|uniref:hypothetical protein n=1 Tax=Testudinibacter sp. TR-2022 TaxID=2585029 RepID=UPI0011193F2A|nr:hypothetical protein [Testudinibacter sp. TR-2022]TNH06494.1 hypothetical protein FHQ30_07795 [Pasteurellaceae bacterium Phil11]TNH21942.1 hypothetical protein FHQ29_08810 [Testudinibacter sp. TR-2022]TNH27502.1 hypothetical protein FHQ27_05080 [Testudinibacter sp. TR-2022]
MKLTAIEMHKNEGLFPTFTAGCPLENLQPCAKYTHWFSCSIQGFDTYVPESFIENNQLNQSYNPTELNVNIGDTVELLAIYYEWAIVKNSTQQVGWLPLAKLYGKNVPLLGEQYF